MDPHLDKRAIFTRPNLLVARAMEYRERGFQLRALRHRAPAPVCILKSLRTSINGRTEPRGGWVEAGGSPYASQKFSNAQGMMDEDVHDGEAAANNPNRENCPIVISWLASSVRQRMIA